MGSGDLGVHGPVAHNLVLHVVQEHGPVTRRNLNDTEGEIVGRGIAQNQNIVQVRTSLIISFI